MRRFDEEMAWLALAAGRVAGRERARIRGEGVVEVLQQRPDAAALMLRARMVEPFLETGGRIVGGALPIPRLEGRGCCPLVLFARGGLELDETAAVAIVGARDASSRGEHRARVIARELVAAGATIVSGGARGIDRAAHEAAIHAGGRTISVLGEPIRRSGEDERPRFLRDLFDGDASRTARSLTVTPFGPWVGMAPALFASRNEFIAGLVDAVVVVEGAQGSGTSHTVNAARDQGVPVFGLPGDVDEALSFVPNLALKMKGRAYLPGNESASDVLASEVSREVDAPRPPRIPRAKRAPVAVPAPPVLPFPVELPPLAALIRDRGGCVTIGEAAKALGWPIGQLLSEVSNLELDGLLVSDGARLRLASVAR